MHPYDDIDIDALRAAGGSKWTTYPDAIGTFIAEADHGTAPSVTAAIRAKVDTGTFGYVTVAEKAEAGRSLARWLQHRFGWEVDPGRIGCLPEVLTSLELTIDHFTRPGSAVILPTPTYMPFFTLPRDHGREIVEVPLQEQPSGTWEFDYDGIDAAFTAGAGLLVLTNPANPTGTVFRREQLLPLVDIVERHGGRVWADEIHAPLVFDAAVHVPYASLSETAARHTITATSASKGWNIPGLKCAQMVFTNDADWDTWRRVSRWPSHTTGYLGVLATIAAYDDGREWLHETVEYLNANCELLDALVTEHLPRARYLRPDATYLAWLDLRDYAIPGNTGRWLRQHAGVAGTDGRLCGRDFDGWFRINFATPKPILTELVTRMGAVLANIR
ncbi:MAG: aminotransferase class I/II-fold pyridoxal phosphate-dependent enzyme [Herbiconiux sp.]|uniref:MalY/PatB family protein n=1 Tax=Herbiconiux sp. TaxID=1871186 RepID=UPI0012299B78|nr:aminotransferase class I/II-fold pyridoxal phosphate-dependent enzyme [Herbiconiux sp.]TAJ50178.1 MAG: aminotransferase class I/II-fold pyridoxal phosphate-dependent enzyme [Herbiconiux sp.]